MAGARGLNLGAIEFFSLFNILFLSIRRISSTEQKSCPEPGRRRRFSHISLEGIFCGRAEGLFVVGWSTDGASIDTVIILAVRLLII